MAIGPRMRGATRTGSTRFISLQGQHGFELGAMGTRRCARIPKADCVVRGACRSARSPATRPNRFRQWSPAYCAGGAATGSSCANGEVKRAREAPCVKTTSPDASWCRPSARGRDRSGTTPHPSHRHTPDTSPASIPTRAESRTSNRMRPSCKTSGGKRARVDVGKRQ